MRSVSASAFSVRMRATCDPTVPPPNSAIFRADVSDAVVMVLRVNSEKVAMAPCRHCSPDDLSRLQFDLTGKEVFDGFAAQDFSSLTVFDGDDRWTGEHVVVRTHRMSVGAGGRNNQKVAVIGVFGQIHVMDHNVTGFTVFPHDAR